MRSRSTAVTLTALLAAACAREAPPAEGTTTLTSGTTHGVRVTNVPGDDERPTLLADELCRREAVCNRVGRDRAYPTEDGCVADLGAWMRVRLSSWGCPPTADRAPLEECLAAVRSEACDTPLLASMDNLPACRRSAVCGD
jgi:hypothetical protein